ncbi:TetR/AcrR family transcriptional regulator [Gordonia sp. NPDC003422]
MILARRLFQWNDNPPKGGLVSTPRSYVSPQREQAARETRARVLATAKDQLLRHGYHSMTVASLAREAGVSPQTIYNSVGGKAAVVKAVYDVLLAGDDEPEPIAIRPMMTRVFEQPDAASTLRAYIHMGCLMYHRVGPLLGVLLGEGPGADRALTEFVDTIERERRTGNASVVRHIADRFGLPDTLTPTTATDILWTATSIEVADRLVRRCGWSLEQLEAWLGDVVVDTLTVEEGQ